MDPDPVPPTPEASKAPDDVSDLDAIAADLAEVDAAMERIEEGTYWTDEVTGEPLDDELLAEHPTARRRTDAPPPRDTGQTEP